MRVKELENTSLICGSNKDRQSLEIPTPNPSADPDLLNEQAILLEFLDTINSDSDDSDNDVSSVTSVCSNCKHPPKKKRTLNIVHAVIQPNTAAFSARGKIESFTDSFVLLCPKGLTL